MPLVPGLDGTKLPPVPPVPGLIGNFLILVFLILDCTFDILHKTCYNKYKLDNDIYMRRCPYEKIPVYDSCPVRHRLFLQGKHRSPETGRFSARHGKKPWKDPPVPQSQRRFLFWSKKRKERTGPHGAGCLYLGGSGHSDMVIVPGRRQKSRSDRFCPHHGGWFK